MKVSCIYISSILVIAEGVLTSAFVIRAPETVEWLRKLGAEPSPPDVIRDQPTIDRLLQEKAKTP